MKRIKMEENLISIVLTLYNKAPYIEETIFSIYKQTYTNRELIIVDDCSTDGSLEIAKSFCEKLGITRKCKFIKNEKNLWVAKTFERGLKEAKGEWISMQDGDDVLIKDKLEKEISVCKEKKIDFCFCEYMLIDKNNNIIGDNNSSILMNWGSKNPNYKIYLLTNNAVGTGVFFNKKIAKWLLEIGFPLGVYQDGWAIILTHLLNGKTFCIKEKLFFYRRSEHCITYARKISHFDEYKKIVFMRYDIQNYILTFEKDKEIIKRIKKMNNIDALFIDRFNGKGKFITIIKNILCSGLGFKYQGILLYQALRMCLFK